MAIMKAGHIARGPLAGAEWVIERLNGEHYLLRVGGSFYSSATSSARCWMRWSTSTGTERKKGASTWRTMFEYRRRTTP